ncbi:MAG: class I SAM-dependent methyltransferase [SAR324 cluster bacterium]|uniref:Class I SAM-dependent methyltransferase n=1 Tax=SAR324 cluster bacterium TaxID=2024889 RepID=A0A7X9FSB1_9DELT|nr:class I SAM-dependent methyltransferase [SAR324 cluster bacterium]
MSIAEKSCDYNPLFDLEPGSFRDRNGRIYYQGNRVYRGLSPEALDCWRHLKSSRFFQEASKSGKVVWTEEISDFNPKGKTGTEQWAAMLCHERIPFISYPYEWSFGMLKDCALLQLELLRAALGEDMILKDATPYNVQFKGASPTFIDILSFEDLQPGQVWVGYKQFCELCLFPLMLQSYRQIPFQSFLRGELEGLSPEVFWKLLSFRDIFRPGVFKHVFLHSKLQHNFADTKQDLKGALANAGFSKELIIANVKGLQRLVQSLKIPEEKTEWSDYSDKCPSYSQETLEAKYRWIERVLSEKPKQRLVWDIGCNTGNFSRLASKYADYVIGMDYDHLAVERFYQSLRRNGPNNVLPMVMNYANASPALGWRGLERKRLEERGSASLIMALAVIHHIVLTANVPIHEFVELLAQQGESLIIEFVTREDPMVKKLLLNKVDQYDEYQTENFEACLSRHFKIEQRNILPSGTRILYYAVRAK